MKHLLLLLVPQILGPILMDTTVTGTGYYCRSITIASGKITGTQSNFPVLVAGTYSYLATEANGGKVKNSSGYDVRFYPSSDCSGTKLDHEIELYTAATGTVAYWVRLSSAADGTVFSVRYGESGITTDQSNKTGVWDSNFKGVWHLPNGSTLSAADSTSNAVNGTINSATAVSGKVDGALTTGGSGYVDLGNSITSPTNLTISAWIKANTAANDTTFVGKGYNGSTATSFELRTTTFGEFGSSVYMGIGSYTTATAITNTTAYSTAVITTGVWTYWVGTYDSGGNIWTLYKDGVSDGTKSNGSTVGPQTTTMKVSIGALDLNGSFGRVPNADIDEVRISDVARSANWVAAEYNNQSSPSTFYTVGSEVAH